MCAVRSSAIVLPKDAAAASISAPRAELCVLELLGAGETCHHGGHGHGIGPVARSDAGAFLQSFHSAFCEPAFWSDVARSE